MHNAHSYCLSLHPTLITPIYGDCTPAEATAARKPWSGSGFWGTQAGSKCEPRIRLQRTWWSGLFCDLAVTKSAQRVLVGGGSLYEAAARPFLKMLLPNSGLCPTGAMHAVACDGPLIVTG